MDFAPTHIFQWRPDNYENERKDSVIQLNEEYREGLSEE